MHPNTTSPAPACSPAPQTGLFAWRPWLRQTALSNTLWRVANIVLLVVAVRILAPAELGRFALALSVIVFLSGIHSGASSVTAAFSLTDGLAALKLGTRRRLRSAIIESLLLLGLAAGSHHAVPEISLLLLLTALFLPGLALGEPAIAYLSGLHALSDAALARVLTHTLACAAACLAALAWPTAPAMLAAYLVVRSAMSLACQRYARSFPDFTERPPDWCPPAYLHNALQLNIVRGIRGGWHELDRLLVFLLGGPLLLAWYVVGRFAGELLDLLTEPFREFAIFEPGESTDKHAGRRVLTSVGLSALILAVFAGLWLLALPMVLQLLAPGYHDTLLLARLFTGITVLQIFEQVYMGYVYRRGQLKLIFVLLTFIFPLLGLVGYAVAVPAAGVNGVLAVRLGVAVANALAVLTGIMMTARQQPDAP